MIHVLIVEPDRKLAQTVQQYFTRNDMKARTALTAQDAIIHADTAKPDVVVLELAMPAHNGIEFLQEFRSYADWLRIPIVVYTHIPREDTGLTAVEWQKMGVTAYMYKPTTGLTQLTSMVQNVVSEP